MAGGTELRGSARQGYPFRAECELRPARVGSILPRPFPIKPPPDPFFVFKILITKQFKEPRFLIGYVSGVQDEKQKHRKEKRDQRAQEHHKPKGAPNGRVPPRCGAQREIV